MRRTSTSSRLPRAVTLVYGLVFVAAFLENMGLRLAVGALDFYFSEPIWQAGIGEAVIGFLLLVSAAADRVKMYWVAYTLSVLGIVFGLSSVRVVGAAREIHILLVPLAVLGITLLVWRGYRAKA